MAETGTTVVEVRPRLPALAEQCARSLRRAAWSTGAWCGVVIVGFVAGIRPLVAAPFSPSDDTIVIATFRPAGSSAAERELGSLRRSLAANSTNLVLALDVARRCLERGRQEADPRYLGQALVALTPWIDTPVPPIDVLVLRATLDQSLHDFDRALTELDAVLARDPRHIQAWLTQATIHTVRADFPKARRAAAHLLSLADGLTATAAIAQIASVTGQAEAACAQLRAARSRTDSPGSPAPPVISAQLVWVGTLLAETLARIDQGEAAEREYRATLARAPRDPYLLGAYADFLLDQGRSAEVTQLLSDFSRIDSLQLRLAEASAAQSLSGRTRELVDVLAARFALARARGERVHLREEARFELRLRHLPAVALALAQANWQIQKEPADARLLLEAARAAHDPVVEAAVRQWVAETKLEDRALRPTTLSQRSQ